MNNGGMSALSVGWSVTGSLAGPLLVSLAADKPPNPADVKAGWLAFGIFIALAVAVVLLWLSFRRQLKKIDFDEEKTVRPRRGTRPGGDAGARRS